MERRGRICGLGGVVSGNVTVKHLIEVWCHVALSFIAEFVPNGDCCMSCQCPPGVWSCRVGELSLRTGSEFPLSSGADGCVGYVGTSSRLRREEPGNGVSTNTELFDSGNAKAALCVAMDKYMATVDRQTGNGMNLIKTHAPLHTTEDIRFFWLCR